MKKMIFALLAVTASFLSSCSYQSKGEPLLGYPELSTFSVLAEDGKTVLTGVKRSANGHVIIEPDCYEEITSDGTVIYCPISKNNMTAYTVNGKEIGNFEMFTPWQNKFYLGVRYVNKTYYFPAVNEIIKTRASLHETELIFIKTVDGWEVRSYSGELKSIIPAESFWLIRDAEIPTKLLIGIEEEGTPKIYTLYTPEGEFYKELTSRKWQQLQKKLSKPTVKAESIFVTDVEGLEKI